MNKYEIKQDTGKKKLNLNYLNKLEIYKFEFK